MGVFITLYFIDMAVKISGNSMAHMHMKSVFPTTPSVCLHTFTPLAYTSTMKLVKISMLSRSCLPISSQNRIFFNRSSYIPIYIYNSQLIFRQFMTHGEILAVSR